jgi:hypothetical protein
MVREVEVNEKLINALNGLKRVATIRDSVIDY